MKRFEGGGETMLPGFVGFGWGRRSGQRSFDQF